MRFLIFMLLLLSVSKNAAAQLPFEVFAGHQKTTLDLMFFKYFKNKQEQNSKFLFFNRNRASMDYRQTSSAYLPQFGFTEAISYNHPNLKGFAPVIVGQVFNSGAYAKAGIQLFRRKGDLTFFSWLVSELSSKPGIDFFILTRFEPRLTEQLRWFTQLELLSTLPTDETANYNFIQRTRIGLRLKAIQFGAAADFNQLGRTSFQGTQNIGAFVRYEF